MDNAKKVALVPQQLLERIASMQQPTALPTMSSLPPLADTTDTVQRRLLEEINGIYHDQDLPIDVRAKNMQQVQHLLGSIRKSVQPIKIQILPDKDIKEEVSKREKEEKEKKEKEEAAQDIDRPDIELEMILEKLPITFRKKARRLIMCVESNENIKWDKKSGIVLVRGVPIPNSNILQIVVDLARKAQKRIPVGWYKVGREILRATDFPKDIIANKDRIISIRKKMLNTEDSDDNENYDEFSANASMFENSYIGTQYGSGRKFKWYSF
jgi:hypothetical protein